MLEVKIRANGSNILPTNQTTITRYQYDNHLASACLELDDSASVISYEEYFPFGASSYRSGRNEVEVSLRRYRYANKERDNETGMINFGKRMYIPWLCRWASVDPEKEQRSWLTPYNYVQNNPINLTDPTGALDDGGGQDPPPVDSDLEGSPNQGKPTTDKTKIHTVKKGDTLSGLAEKYNTTVDALRDANPQTQSRKLEDQINVGEELNIPNSGETLPFSSKRENVNEKNTFSINDDEFWKTEPTYKHNEKLELAKMISDQAANMLFSKMLTMVNPMLGQAFQNLSFSTEDGSISINTIGDLNQKILEIKVKGRLRTLGEGSSFFYGVNESKDEYIKIIKYEGKHKYTGQEIFKESRFNFKVSIKNEI